MASSSPIDLASLIRSTPDPEAPSTPTGLRLKAWSVFSSIAFFACLPWTLLRTAMRHRLGHYPKWQRLGVSLRAQVLNLYFWSKLVLHIPPPHAEEWVVARPVSGHLGKARKGVGVQHVTVEPVRRELVKGLADVRGVQGVPRPGWMLWPAGDGTDLRRYAGGSGLEMARDGEKVVLYLHSGVYLFGHPLETAFAWNNCKSLNVRVFAFNYRKTLDDASAHPAPLLDALAAYMYLTTALQFHPGNITFMGDSAGGHLCLLLTRYLSFVTLPLPGSLCLASPWGDMTVSSTATNPAFPSQSTNDGQDFVSYLADLSIPSGMRHYTLAARRSCWFSPALATAHEWGYLTRTRVYMMYGTKELLADEVQSIAAGMKEAGVDVTLREDVDGMHIGPTIKWPGSNAWQVWIDDVKAIMDGKSVS